MHLEKLHALRKLWLVGSEVTPYGAEHLQHILTTCQIASSKPGGASVSRNEIEGDIEGPFFDWDSLAARIEPAVPGLDVGCAWQVGTALLLWTDIGAKGRSVVSAGTIVTISDDDGRKVHFQWVKNGKNNVARITINGIGYDVAKGNAFLVSTRGRQYRVKQLKRDLTQLKFDPARVPNSARTTSRLRVSFVHRCQGRSFQKRNEPRGNTAVFLSERNSGDVVQYITIDARGCAEMVACGDATTWN